MNAPQNAWGKLEEYYHRDLRNMSTPLKQQNQLKLHAAYAGGKHTHRTTEKKNWNAIHY